jgi:hypothetical protein
MRAAGADFNAIYHSRATSRFVKQRTDTGALANGNSVSGSELQLDTHFETTNGSLDWGAADVILLFNFARASRGIVHWTMPTPVRVNCLP